MKSSPDALLVELSYADILRRVNTDPNLEEREESTEFAKCYCIMKQAEARTTIAKLP